MPGYRSLLDLSSLGDFGFVLRGQNPGDLAGYSLASAGDINNDGFDDFIVGALNAGSNEQGVAYVIFGKAAAFGTVFLFPTLAPPDGFLIEGEANNDDAGSSVASAGDVNNDGYDDIIIGAERYGTGDPGAAYVIFGKASGFGAISLASLALADGYKITGASGFFGHSVASAGDINNDGYDDIIVGESQGASTKGVSYVIFGKASGFANLSAATLSAADGFTITGAATGDGAGVRVSSAGDVNNDGYDDILIGANSHDSGASGAGAAYVIFGKAAGFTNINLASLSAADGFRIDGAAQNDNLGISASSAGDFNNDGYDDILIGANFANGGGAADSGAAYLIFGKASGFSNIDLETLAPADGFSIPGFFRFDNLGADVRAAGDINGDGFGDLIVGAPGTDADGNDAGIAYVLFGHASNFGTVDLTRLTASEGFRIQGDNAGDQLGRVVNAAGDINNDGYDDIMVSSAGAGASGEGRAYVIYGRSSAGTPAVDNGATDTDFATSYTEDQAPVPIVADGAVVISSAQINSMTITGGGGTMTLAGPVPAGITATGAGTGTLILSGAASNADYATALSLVRFAVVGDNPTSSGTVTSRTVAITIDAGVGAQVAGYTTVAVTAIDDPAVARNDSFLLVENTSSVNGNVFANNGEGGDFDPDNGGPGSLTVTQVNGSAGNVGNSFFLPSGAILRVNANGTFTYEPNHAFDSTPSSDSGATNQPAHDSFTYTLAGGSTATVTMTILGLDSADFLVGPAGPNTLTGGNGNDTYLLDDANDLVVETAAGGARDVVYTPVSYTLREGVYVEVLSAASLSGTAPLVLVGNELGQEIYGNAGDNFLQGGGGTDYLIGLGGNDTYFVAGPGDNVVESAGGGTDIIYTPGNYTMIGGLEIELLASSNQAGTSAQTLIGNGFNQTIYGNAGANFIEGGGGTDTLVGLGGNDVYVVDSAGDYVGESAGGGTDVVYAKASYTLSAGQEIEILSTASQSDTASIDLTGNNLANSLYGNAGANILNGGGGADYMLGFGGADTFAFTTALGGGNVDQLGDFFAADDTIALDDAVFAGLAPGALPASAFVAGSAAGDADDRIIYDSATGQLFFDADGNGAGAAILFATVQPGTALNASDFTVI